MFSPFDRRNTNAKYWKLKYYYCYFFIKNNIVILAFLKQIKKKTLLIFEDFDYPKEWTQEGLFEINLPVKVNWNLAWNQSQIFLNV